MDEEFELVGDVVSRLVNFYSQGKNQAYSVWSFDEVADATRQMQKKNNVGKVTLVPEAHKEESKKEEN